MHKPDDSEKKFVSDIRAYLEQRKTELLNSIDEFIPKSLILIKSGCFQGKTLRNSEIAIQASLLGMNDKYYESNAAKLLLVLLHEMAHRIFMRGFNYLSPLDNTPKKMTLGNLNIGLPPDGESEAGNAFELFVFNMVLSSTSNLSVELCHELITLPWNKEGIIKIKEAIQKNFKQTIFHNGKALLDKFDKSKDKFIQDQRNKQDENRCDDKSETKIGEFSNNFTFGKFSSQPYQNYSHYKDPCYRIALKNYRKMLNGLRASNSDEIVGEAFDTSFSQNDE